MAKLKKTLPKNVRELIHNKDWETLKIELLKCEPRAYERGGMYHVLLIKYSNKQYSEFLSPEMVKWIISRENHNFNDKFWDEILNFYVRFNQLEITEILLKAGFNPNKFNSLSEAIGYTSAKLKPEMISLLFNYGTCSEERHLLRILHHIKNFNPHFDFKPENFEQLIKNLEDYLSIIQDLVKYGANPASHNVQKVLNEIKKMFYSLYLNPKLKEHYLECELKEKLDKLEQFELKLYELMQFEPQ